MLYAVEKISAIAECTLRKGVGFFHWDCNRKRRKAGQGVEKMQNLVKCNEVNVPVVSL
jgi:hypothetical protein